MNEDPRPEDAAPEDAAPEAPEVRDVPAEAADGGETAEQAEAPEQAEAADEDDEADPAGTATAAGAPAQRRRDPLAAVLIGVLTLLLGFAFAVQVRATDTNDDLSGAREEDLVRILDELDGEAARLRAQLADQRTALRDLNDSDNADSAALEEARQRADALAILDGTVAAQGPGLTMIIRDPDGAVRVADVLDTIQELRGAGAETMEFDGIRIGVTSAVTGRPGSLRIDGRALTSPYEVVVIGSPQDLETAMNIPGGVVDSVNRQGGTVTITQSDRVLVDALRPAELPQYAEPDPDD